MLITFIFLVIAGIAAGLLASIAGLASLVSYPALLLVGLPPVIANVTNTTALIFSGIGSTFSSLKELRGHWKELLVYTLLSLIGSIGGSMLLLIAPASSFEKVVPFFIFFAGILLFTSGRKNAVATSKLKNAAVKKHNKWWISLLSLIGICVVGAYTGYFGAAGGVIFLAILSVITDHDFATVNAMKNTIAFAGNLVATLIFIFNSHIDWLFVAPLGFGLLIGGYLGPIIVRHVNIHLLRSLISLAAFGLAIYLFVTAYFFS
ncbi:integral membrane protein [Liquorilactobacillus sucicola DSM 21376 = JCM 15457]|uniref:Probable membrane transporter protein n=1 Tax=Liquorilactobacillus sucicola DSM 21376 = JCM 15457 TaxID=1423806 RepID=A0A023CXD9_9LACO|nr:sulfite exporter TauE/SafE family protein [Liquorilactobacillus sucicola]KRN07053.1 integral membrane protein [Liquorilactobacillus sucicola DSM 21376 = JCM 15457]GAJ26547.1 integral membrane protein [Liquorilactobacillus sucicola DSM 21376 = JCM 15457]